MPFVKQFLADGIWPRLRSSSPYCSHVRSSFGFKLAALSYSAAASCKVSMMSSLCHSLSGIFWDILVHGMLLMHYSRGMLAPGTAPVRVSSKQALSGMCCSQAATILLQVATGMQLRGTTAKIGGVQV